MKKIAKIEIKYSFEGKEEFTTYVSAPYDLEVVDQVNDLISITGTNISLKLYEGVYLTCIIGVGISSTR